jgi:UDP-GlcNAc:undecaprenyl-phosphate GlcNAc-1-phosphate transferase
LVALSFLLVEIGKRLAPMFGFVDRPGGRKTHEQAVPLIGGLMIVTVFVAGIFAFDLKTQDIFYLLIGIMLTALMGAWDDRAHLLPWLRFCLQIWLACFVVIFAGAELRMLGNLFGFGPIGLNVFSVAFSVTCLVLFMNAMNMLDGLDGLAGGYFFILALALIILGFAGNIAMHPSLIFVLMVPLGIFLFYNMRTPFRNRAAIFLGDAGSLSISLLLGWLAIKTVTSSSEIYIPPVTIIWLMTVPIVETFSIFFTRMGLGRSPFEADRLHLHYLLKDRGWPPILITPFILSLAAISCAVGVSAAFLPIPEAIYLYSWSALLIMVTFLRIRMTGNS